MANRNRLPAGSTFLFKSGPFNLGQRSGPWVCAAALALVLGGCATVQDQDGSSTAQSPTQTVEPVSKPDVTTKPAGDSADDTASGEPTDGERRMATEWTVTDEVVALSKEWEGFKAEAYKGYRGQWLIGYGHSRTAQEGMTVTEEEATALLRDDLQFEGAAIAPYIKVPVTRNEYSAMVSVTSSIGSGNFRKSSVLRFLNEDKRPEAADAFLLWNKVTVNGERVVNRALMRRRTIERAIFLGEPAPAS